MTSATSPLKSRRRTLQGVLREQLPQIEATSKAGYRMRTIVACPRHIAEDDKALPCGVGLRTVLTSEPSVWFPR
jgi:hypothetical protein